MSTADSKATTDLYSLRIAVKSVLALLSSFQSSLTSSEAFPPSDISNQPNPLRLLSDACALLKAQTTKLSLLIINKPFTPTAITFILNNISTECLPALITALELCPSKQYTALLREHIRANLLRIMKEMTSLLATIPVDEKVLVTSVGSVNEENGRDTLSSTGVIWEVCDTLMALASNGLVDLAVNKADAYHALIKDALAELEEWNPDEEDDDMFSSGSSAQSESNQGVDSEHAAGSPPTTAMNAMTLTPPATPTPIRQMYDQTLATLRMIRLLYPALRKRRVQTFPSINSSTPMDQLPTSWQIYAFDNLMKSLRTFSETADELAGSLYSQDEEQASGGLEAIRIFALECIQDVDQSWDRKEDEFTAWAQKWARRLEEISPNS
ncbi:MAG: hypothetical protein HETSPECPRED_007536 [Heterodermia speciosa]|uniref:Cyclin-D1-binding protein 1-like N-terminal domain-containing protein n=1 Tax=Heterodermia speciosa TaxID=116794 RepID=A0A8H3FSJ9_9LECA|nr:MAG: hypothetical protein HETSPECPRED_007536 [Heterodermia speciosa]